MKGVKTFAVINGTSKRFQSDDILAERIYLPNNIEVTEVLTRMSAEQKKLNDLVTKLTTKMQELEEKVNSFETEEAVAE